MHSRDAAWAECSSTGDPHIWTFDRVYDFFSFKTHQRSNVNSSDIVEINYLSMLFNYNFCYKIKYSNVVSIIYHRYHHVYEPGDYYLVISHAPRNFQVTTSQNFCLKSMT